MNSTLQVAQKDIIKHDEQAVAITNEDALLGTHQERSKICSFILRHGAINRLFNLTLAPSLYFIYFVVLPGIGIFEPMHVYESSFNTDKYGINIRCVKRI